MKPSVAASKEKSISPLTAKVFFLQQKTESERDPPVTKC